MTAPNVTPQQPPTPPQPGAASTTPPASGVPPAPSASEFRFGNDATVPEWARGRSAAEVLTLATQMAAVLPSAGASAVTGTGSPPATPVPEGAPDWFQAPDAAAARLRDDVLSKVTRGFEETAAQNAANARAIAARLYDKEFGRWAPEIDLLASRIPATQRTVENYENLIRIVKANHLEELATERAKELVAAGGVMGERSGGNGAIPGAAPSRVLDFEQLGPAAKEAAQRHGLTEQQVLDFCRKTGWPVEKWVEATKSGKVVTSETPFEFQLTEEAVGVRRQFSD